MMDFIRSRTFSGMLALLNGYFCFQSLNHGQFGWAVLSGFFTWLCAKNYLDRA
jgi:hypothetical protein